MFAQPPIGKSLEKSIRALYKNLFGNLPKSFASLKTDYFKFLSSPEQWQWKQKTQTEDILLSFILKTPEDLFENSS